MYDPDVLMKSFDDYLKEADDRYAKRQAGEGHFTEADVRAALAVIGEAKE